MSFNVLFPSIKDNHMLEDDLWWRMTFTGDKLQFRTSFIKITVKETLTYTYMPLQSNEEPKNKTLNKSLTQNMWLFFSLFFQVDYLGIKFNFVL